MSMSEDKIEISYSRPSLGKRFLAMLIDVFFFGFLSFVLFSLSNSIVASMDFYKNNNALRSSLQAESSLYVEGDDIVSYVKNHEELFNGVRAEKDYLSSHIDAFYANEKFLDAGERSKAIGEYNSRKAIASKEGEALFTLKDGAYVENDVNPNWHLDFYSDEINNHCRPLFTSYIPYIETTKTIWISSLVEILISVTISYFLFYVVVPLWLLKRGRLTIGRSIFKIGMIGKDAFNVSSKRFLLKALFCYVAYIILDIAFLIPLFISAGMLFLSNRNQSLSDYVLGTYMVDVTNDDVYLDINDYLDRKNLSKKASIENKSFELDNHGL